MSVASRRVDASVLRRVGTSAHRHIGTSAHRHIGTSAFRSMQAPCPHGRLASASPVAHHASTSGGSAASARACARSTSITR
ncbi:hypothetical protein A8F67_09580 [Burkholderia cenocepacia]|nr:hypothetical protein A8F61_04370 [Burkholderia cenocepacia]OOB20363.1 hypothetical protein A8F67_09580 [Burkholderia cenocepacia]OOB35506.1 hypothetical protein A8F74_21870 [Burkholderia cenocepacia]